MRTSVVAVALLGVVTGTVLDVIIERLPRREPLRSPWSRCGGCVATKAAVGLLSAAGAVMRGRCGWCGAAISARRPLVQALTATVFATVAVRHGRDAELLLSLPLAATLIVVAGIDLGHRIVPNRVLLPAAVWAVGLGAVVRPDAVSELLTAGVAAFLALLAVAVVHPAGMGMGDAKLAGVMGLYLGASVVPALMAAILGGSAFGLAKIVREGLPARHATVPFAPFLTLGGVVGLVAGPELVELYAQRLL